MASKGTHYKEEQIIRILKEVESGISVTEVCRKYGVSEQTVYR
jgi:putative transposase